jgi:hypothetical protein
VPVSSRPRLILVVGIGRSGTSAFSGAVAGLGYAVPQPEIASDETNPRGFGEPKWAVTFQAKLLRACRVGNFDGRPYAWRYTKAEGEKPESVAQLRGWLSEQFEQHDRVVVKDPRTVWLLPLWKQVSTDLGLDTSFVTMLRPPAEVVASASRWYSASRHTAARLSGWVNVLLRTERVTRDSNRAFLRYSDLLSDWRKALTRLDSALGLELALKDQAACAQVDAWLDPGLRREKASLADIDAPAALVAIADRLWDELNATANRDTERRRRHLDQIRADYRRLYLDAEQMTQSSIEAGPRRSRAAKPQGDASADAPATPSDSTVPAPAE